MGCGQSPPSRAQRSPLASRRTPRRTRCNSQRVGDSLRYLLRPGLILRVAGGNRACFEDALALATLRTRDAGIRRTWACRSKKQKRAHGAPVVPVIFNLRGFLTHKLRHGLC